MSGAFRLRTVRARLLLLAIGVEVVMLTVMVANSLRLQQDAMISQVRAQAAQFQPVLQAALTAPLAQRDYATAQAVIEESRSSGGVEYLVVVDRSGKRVAAVGWPADRPLPAPDPEIHRLRIEEDLRYDVAAPIVMHGQPLGTLHIGLDISRIVAARRSLLIQGIGIAAAEIILSALILLLLGYWLTRHLTTLTRASLAVASGNLAPPPVPEGQDDVGQLGVAFNTMSRAIAERVSELTAAKEAAEASEREKSESEARLRQSEERLRLAIDGARLGTWHWDVKANVLVLPEQTRALFGAPIGQAISLEAFLAIVHPEDREAVHLAVRRAVEEHGDYVAEYRIVRPDGLVLWLAAMGRVAYDVHGAPEHMEGVVSDITPRKRAELGLRELNVELEQKVEARTAQLAAASAAKSVFLAQMSHEIRTPLHAVLGLAQLLEREPLSADQRAMVERIRRAGRSLHGILNDILDLSRIEAGQLVLEARPFSLLPLLDTVLGLLDPLAKEKGIALTRDVPPGLPEWLSGDAARLEQVLVNLVGNGVKFTERGEVRLRVRVPEESASAVRLRVEVQDTGIGIAPAALETLFAPFTQADQSITRRYGGTGLGLSICRHLVGLMGGTIGVSSAEGVGSTFWVELPFGRTAEGAAPPPAASAATGPRLAGCHLLVVDDNPLNREVLVRALTREGGRVTQAGDGRQALALLRDAPAAFAAILMDVQMPEMDGLTATRAIRGDLGLATLPVVAVTAGVLPEEQAAALAAGASGVLAKPVDLEDLVATVRRWVPDSPATATPVAPAPPASADPPAAPMDGIPSIPGIDTDQASRTLGGDREFFLGLLRRFLGKSTEGLAEVRAALAAEERAAAARRLHTLRGEAGNVGAMLVMRAAEALEGDLKSGRSDAAAGLERLADQLAGLREAAAPWLVPAAPAPAEDSAPALDPARLAALRDALARKDLAALGIFVELAPALGGVRGSAAVRALQAALQELRFAEALRLLDQGA